MRRKGLDIFLFLVIILLGGVAIGLVLGVRKKDREEKKYLVEIASNVAQDTIFFEDIIQSLQLLFESRNIGMLANAIYHKFNADIMYSLVAIIIKKERFLLNDQDKLSFLLMLAYLNNQSKTIQFKLFDLMMQSGLFTDFCDPDFFFVVNNKYFLAVLPSFLEWMQYKKVGVSNETTSDLKSVLIDKVFCAAIEHNDLIGS